MFGGTVDDSSTPIMETSLWNFLVSEGAIPPDSVEGKKDEKCVLNKIGQAALHSGFSVGILLKKLCSQAHVDPGSYEVVASNKAQNRVQNWQWVSETMPKLSKVEVQPIDSTAKMLAVSGDFGVINAILFDLKAAIGPMASAPVVRSEQNGNRPTAVATSSDCSVGSNLRPVLQPMSAVRIDRMRQVLVERLKACVGGEAAEDLVPSSEVYQSQPLNQSCLALHRGLIHGFESTELKGSSYQSLLTWMSTLMDQRMNGSDFTHIASAVRLIKDAACVNYFLHLFVVGLKSHDKDVVVATARILCFVCEHISVELLLPLYMWFYKGDQEGARILTEAFSRQPHLHSTLFRVLRATAGEKIAQVITETLSSVMKSKIDYFALMAEILPLISKEELSERGTERIIVTLLDAGLKYCKEADNGSNSKAISALQMLTAVWVSFPSFLPAGGKLADGILDALRHTCKEAPSQVKLASLSCSFDLLYVLTRAKHKSAATIYKSLVFSLIETHVGVVEGMPGIHVVHQFLQANLKTALRKIPSLPVQVMVEPLIKQHVSQGYNNLDLDFFHSIAIHPRLGIRQALLLLHFVAKVAINDIVYGQLSSKLVFSLLDRFHNQPAVQNYLVKYMRVAFSLLIRATEMLDNVTKGEEGEEEKEENDEKNDNANAPERLNLVMQMIEKVWNAMCSQLSFKSQVSPLAQSVIKDYKEFFPDRDVPEILYKISQQRKSPKAYEPGENDAKKPHTSPGKHRRAKSDGGSRKDETSPKERRARRKPHTAGEDKGYSHKRESGYSKQQGKTGAGGGYGAPAKRRSSKTNKKGDLIAVKAGEIADEKAAKAKRAKIEARMRKREQDKERERREKDEFERERQKELQRQKIERQTRRRIEKLRKERMQKQANRQNVLGSTPGGTPLISNEEEMFGDVDKRLWGEFRVQIKRLVRTYAGTRPDPVAKKTFSAINQAHNTLSLAEFLKLWSDLKMSPHQISRREITQMYRTLGGKDQIYGARQLCSGIRMLSQHDKTKAALSKVLGKDAGESDVDERVQAMMKYLKDTWHRCKYTPHSLWDPPKRQSKRRGSISEAEIQKKTQELNKLLEANAQAELPENFEKKTVKKLTKTWPEAEEAAKEALAGLLKKQFEMVYDFGDPPERETEVLEAVYTGKGDSKRDSEPAPTKSKYDPNRRRKEMEEKRKKDEETKKEEMKKLEERRKEQHRKMAIKMAQAQIKKKQKKAQREKEQREKEEEEQKKKEEEQKKQAVIRKKRKEKIKKYKQQKAEEERKKKEQEEKMKKIKEEEQKKKIALYLKMKKEKDKLEAAKKKEMEALLAKQREEEDAKKKEKEAREKAREDKRRKEAKAKVEMRRLKKEEEKKAAELAKKKKQEEDAAKEAAKEKRMQDRLARRAKKVKKQLEEAEKSQAASNADAEGQSGGKAAAKGKKTPKKKADKTSPIISPKSGAEALSDFAMTDDEGQEKVVLQAVQVGDEGGETLVNADGKEEEWNVQKEEKKGKGEDGAAETPAAKEEAKKDEAGADKEEEAKKEEAKKEEAKKEEVKKEEAKKEEAKKQDAEKEDQAKAGKEEDEKKSEESEKPAPEESGGKDS